MPAAATKPNPDKKLRSYSTPKGVNHSPGKRKGSTTSAITYPICSHPVEDAAGKKKGHNAVFCDGACQEWVHRQFGGLSKVRYDSITKFEEPFLCPQCVIAKQSKDIFDLKLTVASLEDSVNNLLKHNS